MAWMTLTSDDRDRLVTAALVSLALPLAVSIRAWREADFPDVQRLSKLSGWRSALTRPAEAFISWQHSWPTLIATRDDVVVGFVRALTDGEVTMYIAEVLVEPERREQGIGRALLTACHALYPRTRVDLLSTDAADDFYRALGFRPLPGFRRSYGRD